jgi:nitrite reductase/ring-hydroxylating ferredoxin subunit
MDGDLWTCQSEYRDRSNHLRKINGLCQGGNAASYHSNSNKAITFKQRATYYAFGFRDAGRVYTLTMKCEGKNVNFKTQEKYVDDKNTCKTCSRTYSCASGKPVKLQMEKVMAWNTNQKTSDHALSASFKQFTTNAASLVDSNTGGTGINVISNYFWWFAVKLTAECYQARFQFMVAGNLHHLRTAYSQDGDDWTCASDFNDTGNNRRTHSDCKGGRAASYHSNRGKMIYFSAAAKYYAFGFRDAGRVSNLQMWCNEKLVPTK